MRTYFDSGVLLKLYTNEPSSGSVRDWVRSAGQPLPFLSLHRSECASALHLKAFRKECTLEQANRALADIEEDVLSGVLRMLEPKWEIVWARTGELALAHAASTGCRTLDTLHVAAAQTLGFRHFATSDNRQALLARRVGLTVHNPTEP